MHAGHSQGRNYGILTPNPMLAAWCMAIPIKTVAKTVKQLGYEYGLRGRWGGGEDYLFYTYLFNCTLHPNESSRKMLSGKWQVESRLPF